MSGALFTAMSGLRTAQQQLGVISLNVSNASTPGYTKKTLNQSTVFLGDQGVGVIPGELQRATQTSLLADLLRQNGRATSAKTGEEYSYRIQQTFGTPDSNQSFSATLSALKSSFIALSADPSNGVRQSEIVSRAQAVASKLNNNSQSIQSLRNNAEVQIQDSVVQINALAQNIADANVAIVSSLNRGHSAADLMDQRDQYIQEISQYLDITTFRQGDGTIVVQSGQGAVIAERTASTFSFTAQPQSYSSYYPGSANGLMLNGVDVTSQISSGKLGRLFELRDETLPAAQAMLDEVAHKLALRFEAQGVTLFTDADGNVPTDVVANYLGFSANITVNPDIVSDPTLLKDGTGGGSLNDTDNTNILKIIDYAFGDFEDSSSTAHTAFRTTNLGASGTLSINLPPNTDILNYANNVIATQAQNYSQTKSENESEGNYYKSLQETYLSETGVNIDDEMTRMITFQQGYAACARVITAVKEMQDILMQAV